MDDVWYENEEEEENGWVIERICIIGTMKIAFRCGWPCTGDAFFSCLKRPRKKKCWNFFTFLLAYIQFRWIKLFQLFGWLCRCRFSTFTYKHSTRGAQCASGHTLTDTGHTKTVEPVHRTHTHTYGLRFPWFFFADFIFTSCRSVVSPVTNTQMATDYVNIYQYLDTYMWRKKIATHRARSLFASL